MVSCTFQFLIELKVRDGYSATPTIKAESTFVRLNTVNTGTLEMLIWFILHDQCKLSSIFKYGSFERKVANCYRTQDV